MMPDVGYPASMPGGVPVVPAPEEIDVTTARRTGSRLGGSVSR